MARGDGIILIYEITKVNPRLKRDCTADPSARELCRITDKRIIDDVRGSFSAFVFSTVSEEQFGFLPPWRSGYNCD